MKLADLSPERRAWLAGARWDRIIEKHEGPWDWRWDVEHNDAPEERPEFLILGGYEVLLPVAAAEHPKISALWLLPSAEGRILTIYLKNVHGTRPDGARRRGRRSASWPCASGRRRPSGTSLSSTTGASWPRTSRPCACRPGHRSRGR